MSSEAKANGGEKRRQGQGRAPVCWARQCPSGPVVVGDVPVNCTLHSPLHSPAAQAISPRHDAGPKRPKTVLHGGPGSAHEQRRSKTSKERASEDSRGRHGLRRSAHAHGIGCCRERMSSDSPGRLQNSPQLQSPAEGFTRLLLEKGFADHGTSDGALHLA